MLTSESEAWLPLEPSDGVELELVCAGAAVDSVEVGDASIVEEIVTAVDHDELQTVENPDWTEPILVLVLVAASV